MDSLRGYYAGIGSRDAPQGILEVMKATAAFLASQGWCLRSGKARGSDTAFEIGCGTGPKQIFTADDCTDECLEIAKTFHPVWSSLQPYHRKLHGRNALQILGPDLRTPVSFVVCWTPEGCTSHYERTRETGGTGTAISIATFHGVYVYNLKRSGHLEKICRRINYSG